MRTLELKFLEGANYWSDQPLLAGLLELPTLENRSIAEIPDIHSLIADLPAPHPSDPAAQDVANRLAVLRLGREPAIRLPEHVARILLGLTGAHATFARTAPASLHCYHVVVGVDDPNLDRDCIVTAWSLLCRALNGLPNETDAMLSALMARANEERLGPSTWSLVRAAQERGIPTTRLSDSHSLIQLGWGSRQHRLWTSETDHTSSIAAAIAGDKQLARSLLQRSQVPVPAGQIVRSAAEAWDVATTLGLPVVVKPRDANRGRGVSTSLSTREQVESAYLLASRVRQPEHADVLVERHILGVEHRLLVVDGRMIAAYRSAPPSVVGDGRRSIAELVCELNRDPLRGTDWRDKLGTVILDDQARLFLHSQGLTIDSIPRAGEVVAVRREADLCIDVTNLVHPDIAEHAVDAAALVGLDVAGIDVIVADIGRPLAEQGGAIIEVNSGPCLAGHVEPSEGTPRPVAEAIIQTLFAAGDDGRIPIIAVTGASTRSTLALRIANSLAAAGNAVGFAGLGLAPSPSLLVQKGTVALSSHPCLLLRHPRLDLLVVDISHNAIQSQGMGFDRCHLAVLCSPASPDEAQAAQFLLKHLNPAGIIVARAEDQTFLDSLDLAPHHHTTVPPTETLENAVANAFNQSDSAQNWRDPRDCLGTPLARPAWS